MGNRSEFLQAQDNDVRCWASSRKGGEEVCGKGGGVDSDSAAIEGHDVGREGRHDC